MRPTQHGLYSDGVALITSDCGTLQQHGLCSDGMALITSDCGTLPHNMDYTPMGWP